MYHKILFSILILYTSFSFAQREVWEDSTSWIKEKKYETLKLYVIGEKKPFTGYTKRFENNSIVKHLYKNGKSDGCWSTYYIDGKIKEKGYYNMQNDYEGDYKKYHPNGNIMIEGKYKNNKKDGAWFYFNENGKIVQGGHYFNDEKQGIWRFWNENGIMYYEEIFQNGELKSMIFYNNEDDTPLVPNIDK